MKEKVKETKDMTCVGLEAVGAASGLCFSHCSEKSPMLRSDISLNVHVGLNSAWLPVFVVGRFMCLPCDPSPNTSW